MNDLFGEPEPVRVTKKQAVPVPVPVSEGGTPRVIRARRSPWIDAHFKFKPYWYPKGLSEPLVPWDHADIDLS